MEHDNDGMVKRDLLQQLDTTRKTRGGTCRMALGWVPFPFLVFTQTSHKLRRAERERKASARRSAGAGQEGQGTRTA